MQRGKAIAGSTLFLFVAPGTVAGLIPWLISRWRFSEPFFGVGAFRVLGVVLMAAGLPVLLSAFARFALQGLGTPSPSAPPERLVVTGWYRHVRNPMYVAVVSLIFGQGLLFGNAGVLAYGLVAWVVFHVFVLAREEPRLRGRFGAEYQEYCAHVRRWIPRVRPWSSSR
ncbi:MAG TPA: isoprenylcysteine carboxylmethyltransferase family protein [Myxococcaceae bacterium]|jgi:protein-S-isoprenylcysteine O-methyltransferase Ste14